jgi:hypothetical protein
MLRCVQNRTIPNEDRRHRTWAAGQIFDLIRSGNEAFSVAPPPVAGPCGAWLNRLFSGAGAGSLPDEDAGWQFIDRDHNLPVTGAYYEPPVDFRSGFKKVWNRA